MDLISSTVPDDHAEEIKKRLRERDGSDDESRPRKRARADTRALLPPGADGLEGEEPPKPEEDLDRYDVERLQRGLSYINGAAKRKITPRTQEFLRQHKDAYKVALESGAEDKASCAVVQALDKVYYSTSFYLKPRSAEEFGKLQAFVKLRRLELLANYGDYLGQELQQIRADLKAAAKGAAADVQKAKLELSPPRTWLAIADELAGADMGDLRKHVYVACGVLGMDPHHMLWLIEQWGDRNRRFHNQVRQYITDCHWPALAKQIWRDLKELPNAVIDPDDLAKYETVLVSVQKEYFDVLDKYDPQHWLPNQKARDLLQEKVAKLKKRA
jgi:hypothetical protein